MAGGRVIAGLLLTSLSWWFLLLTALGTFGPGILREMGWLRDKDEFQRRADHRAGYHALLTSGLVSFVLVAFFRSGGTMENSHRLATSFLALLWFTWFLSSLLAYWGPQKTAARILLVFGSVWLVFTIISNLGPEWTGWAALLLHPLPAVPFFALAWLSRRRPRVTGILLLAVSVFFFQFFGLFSEGIEGVISTTFILFLGPLLASGVALLGAGKKSECPEEAEEVLMTGNRSNVECEVLSALQRSSMSGLRSACSFDALTDQGDPAAIPPRCHRFEASQGISPTLAVASLRHQPP